MKTSNLAIPALLARTLSAFGEVQVAPKKVLTLDGARQVIAAAMAQAKKDHSRGAIAVVDDGGNLMALEKLDGTFAAGWDEKKKVVMRYDARADGTLSNGKVFFDMTSARGEDALDGMKVDQKGDLYVSGSERRQECRRGTHECFSARRPGKDWDENGGRSRGSRGCRTHWIWQGRTSV